MKRKVRARPKTNLQKEAAGRWRQLQLQKEEEKSAERRSKEAKKAWFGHFNSAWEKEQLKGGFGQQLAALDQKAEYIRCDTARRKAEERETRRAAGLRAKELAAMEAHLVVEKKAAAAEGGKAAAAREASARKWDRLQARDR